MGKLTRSQKKGKKSSYTCRFLKNRFKLGSYKFDLANSEIVQFKKMPLVKGIVMKVLDKTSNTSTFLLAPYGARLKEKINESSVKIKKLKDFQPGDTVCNIELRKDTSKFLCRAAGTCAKLVLLQDDKAKLSIKDRTITLSNELRAMYGRVNSGDHWMKPLLKAGTSMKIAKARGKKYPHVSATKMNVQDHKLGGSYRKRLGIPTCTRRTRPPGAKYGNIAASRTGKK